jgi:hypothetical protein
MERSSFVLVNHTWLARRCLAPKSEKSMFLSRANHTSCSLPDVVKKLSSELQEDQAPNNLGTTVDVGRPGHVTAIHEIAYKEMEWHIAKLSKTSTKACFAQQAITKKKCEEKIVQGNRATAASTYTGVILHVHKKKEEVM